MELSEESGGLPMEVDAWEKEARQEGPDRLASGWGWASLVFEGGNKGATQPTEISRDRESSKGRESA